MSEIITFHVEDEYKHLPEPQPAIKYMPSWYTNLDRWYSDPKPDGVGSPREPTVRQCMPVLDAMMSGYIITWPGRCEVWWDGRDWGYTSDTGMYFERHPSQQLGAQNYTNSPALKLLNPWSITTPPGWSVMFTEPIWRNNPMVPITAIVDTDKYQVPVNFPMTIRQSGHFMLDSSMPMVQVIPIKRAEWESKVVADQGEIFEWKQELKRTHHTYRKKWWHKKKFKKG